MSNSFNLNSAILTSAITLIGGVILFILQKIIDRFFLDPIKKQKEIIEQIAIYLIHYAKLYTNPETSLTDSYGQPKTQYINAIEKTRELAALLKVRTDNVPLYSFWKKINYVLSKDNIATAWRELIGLSNSYTGAQVGMQNSAVADKIRDLLNIPRVS